MNVKYLAYEGIYLVGTIQKETGILKIVSTPHDQGVAQFNDEGIWYGYGGAPGWNDDFIDACVNAGYEVGAWEYQEITIGYHEKLPYWDTCVEV